MGVTSKFKYPHVVQLDAEADQTVRAASELANVSMSEFMRKCYELSVGKVLGGYRISAKDLAAQRAAMFPAAPEAEELAGSSAGTA